MEKRNGVLRGLATVGACGAILLVSCASPIYERDAGELRRSIAQSVGRELAEARVTPGTIVLQRENRAEALELRPEVVTELERTTGPAALKQVAVPLGPSLLPAEQRVAPITLERAIRSAVANNLNLQFARLTPAIAEARLVAAQAAFDWVFFNNAQWNNQDQPRVTSAFNDRPTGATATQQQVLTDTMGVRRRLVSGGQFTVQHQFTYTDVNTPGSPVFPDPAYESNIVLQLDQPLLRNAGSDAALAQVRLNQNSERDEIQQLKVRLLQTVTQTEETYWSLVRAQYDLRILQWLYEAGERDRQKLATRRGFDVKPSTYSDVVSQVEARRAQIIQAQRNLRIVSNQLKTQMNDPDLTVGSEVLLAPADDTIDAPAAFNLADAVMLAVANRPEVQRAILSIDDTQIRLQLAENARLPLLDLQLQTRFSGLGDTVHDSYGTLSDSRFVDYLVGLRFEQPLGNREAEANYRVRRIEQMQSVISYRSTVQGIVQEVKNSLIDVAANYTLIDQRRAARLAAAENLRTLEIEEQNIAAFTTEFVDLKLRRQQELANAEQQEILAMTTYNNALSQLYAAMGMSLERNQIQFDVPDAPRLERRDPLYPMSDAVSELTGNRQQATGNR